MAVTDRYHRPAGGRCAGVLAVMLAACLLASAAPARAASTSKSAVLIVDANTGRDLHASAADELRHPASLAKMMTLYLAFERIEQGRLSYQTKIRISAHAAATAPTKLDLDEGDEIALIDAMKAVIVKSANDMAVAIAEHIGGSEESFARLMTQRARQLGMASTTFRNASGLPDEEQVTTARDMVTLALRLMDDYPKHYPLFATQTFTYKDESFRSHNTLLSGYEGTDGIKTGYTRASGFNLVSSVRRGRKHIVGAVFGGASAASRNAAMRTYLNMGLVKASNEKTRRPAPALVARLNTGPERKIGAVPVPQRVERPAARLDIAAAPPPAHPAPAAAPAPGPAIEVARVRPVLVEGRHGSAAADEPRPSRLTFEDILARADQASAPAPTWTTASAGTLRSNLSAAPERPALLADAAALRGAPPSTFEQQAANLERGQTPLATTPGASWPTATIAPAASRQAPAPTPAATASTAASAGGFHIQIGAYQSLVEAERKLASARELAPGLLAKRAPVTTQVKVGDKLYFRARYAGFEAPSAASACGELKKLKIDCLVMKAE